MDSGSLIAPDAIRHPRKAAFSYYWEVILAGVLIAELALIQIYFPRMLRPNIFLGITINFMEAGIVALFMAFIIISKNIDISVGALISLVSMTMALCVRAGLPDWAAIAGGLVTGLVGGMFNGFLTAGLKIPSLVVTLGTMSLYRGITYVAFGDETFSAYSQAVRWLGRGKLWGIVPFPLIVFAVLAVVSWFVLQRTTFGRQVYAIGNNETAALYSGVRVKRVVVTIFAMVGVAAAIAGIIMTGRNASTRGSMALGLELDAITAVVLGGVSIDGGRGHILGVVEAVFVIGLIRNGMYALNISPEIMKIVIGSLLIISLLLPKLIYRTGRS